MARSQFFYKVRHLLLFVATLLTITVLPYTFTPATEKPIFPTPAAQELAQQGENLYEAEQFNDAVLVLQQALAAFRANDDQLHQAITLSNLSLAYQQLGQWRPAEQAIAESLNLLKTGRNLGSPRQRRQILAQALDVQGRLQLLRGQAELALVTWQQATEIYVKLDDRAGVARSRINSAQALQAMGLYLQAQKTLTEVDQILQTQPNSSLKATGLRSLGNVFRVVGDLEKSRQVLEQSLAVAQASQSPQAIGDALLNLGNTNRAQRRSQAALKLYQQAATTATPTTRVQAQLNQLSLLLDDKQFMAAQALLPQIQPQIQQLPPNRTAIYARINFAQSLTRLRQQTTNAPSWRQIAQVLATAQQHAKDLADQRATSYVLGSLGALYEQTQQWADAANLTQQALFVAQAIDAPDVAYRWQWQLGRLLKEQRNIQGAIAAYTEAVNNLKFLRSDLVAINPEVQFDFREQVEPVYRQLVDLLLQPSAVSEPSQENLVSARNVIESLQLAELENFFRSACLDAKPEQIDSVVDSEDQKAAVIYPIILADRIEVILKLPNAKKLHHYVTKKPQAEVESLVEELQQYLREPDRVNDVKELSQQVYSWLVQPLAAQLGKTQVRTLVFVLDGVLRNIPMTVLYDASQQQYLLEQYAVALTPGLQLLEPQPLQQKRLIALTAGVSEERNVEGREFPRLANVRLELQRIESQVPKSRELVNQAFTKINLQNQIDTAAFSIVHLATHGTFSSNLEETFILTWNQLLKVKDLDNLLRTSDQRQSKAIELLVLSACETAAGDRRAALGLAGIAVRAGARSTLATLWSVDDQSTAELMSEFYHQLIRSREKPGETVTKAEALQRAQLALWQRKNQDWKRPYFWAPYVLVGNWL